MVQITNFVKRGTSLTVAILMVFAGLQVAKFSNPEKVFAAGADYGSICFNNPTATSYISLNNSANAVGTSDFTLEMWLKAPGGNSGAMTLVNGHAAVNTASSLNLFFDGNPGQGNDYIGFSHPAINSGSGQIQPNRWVHVAYVRQNQTGKTFVNGVPGTSAADTNNYTSTNFKLGYSLSGSWPIGFNGCVADVALSKVALYGSNFASNLPYPASRTAPTNSIIFLKATSGGFTNTGSGAAPSVTGGVTYNADLPALPAIAIASAAISGTASYGRELTASAGTVTNASSYTTTYQWLRDGIAINGAINNRYTLTTADVATRISVTVTVNSGTSTASATSSNTSLVSKATPLLSWSSVTKTYGDAAFSLTPPTASIPGTFSYASATTSVATLSGSTTTILAAGSTVITATFTPDDTASYTTSTSSMTLTVSKKELSVTASSHSLSYGDATPTISPSYSGFVNGDGVGAIANLVCATTYTTSTPVGTIATTCSGATATNYSFAYTAGVITVGQGVQTSTLAITSRSTTYGTPLSLTTTGGSGSGATSFVVDSGPCTIAGSTLTSNSVGTCMVTATKAANGNYLASSSISTAITVARKNLTVTGLTGVNKVFDHGLTSSVTGNPSLFGVVGLDDVLLDGTPVYTFATPDVANGKTVSAAGFTLAGTTANNYTLTQPTITANITKKTARVIATDVTVAFGSTVTGAFTTSGLLGGDSISAAAYTFSGTGTSSAPTAVGVYSITPSNAVFGSGSNSNYNITYESAVLTILALYTTTYNANGGLVANGATSSVDYVVGDNALSLPTPTRANFTFTGWFTQQTNGVQVTGLYTPTSNATLWARWVQNSLYGMGNNTKVLTITTLAGVGNTYSASAGGGTIAIEYLADALPAGTVIDAYVLADTSNASTVIGAGNNYVMSLVLAWLAPDGTVPTTANGKAISMTITNASIKRGAKIYSVIGSNSTLLGTAAVDGAATVAITDDPQIFVAITRPDAPTGVTATPGNTSSTTVSWAAPASDGGSTITGYTVTSNTGVTCTSVTTTCSMTGLANGSAYTFTVTATNAIGTSTTSTPSASITLAAPSGGSGGSEAIIPVPTSESASDAAEAKALAKLKKGVTVYSVSVYFKLTSTYSKQLAIHAKAMPLGSTVLCTGYVQTSKSVSYAKAKSVASNQAKALCASLKKANKTLILKTSVMPASTAPQQTPSRKLIPVSYRLAYSPQNAES